MGNVAKFVGFVVLGLMVVGFFIIVVFAGFFMLWNPNTISCEVHTIEMSESLFIVNGEFDAGYEVTTVIENQGPQAELIIIAELTSSEGSFQRKQRVPFYRNESKSLTYQFHEPTISVTNVSPNVSCS